MDPLSSGAVSCQGATRPLRVFYGHACQLWRRGNSLQCAWDALAQAFVGAGCAHAAPATQCMCRHLTDFVAVLKPNSPVASLSPAPSPSAAGVFDKLRFLVAAVAVLFLLLNVGALAAALADSLRRRRLLALVARDRFGFREQPGGAWTWEVWPPDPLRSPLEQVRGSAVELCEHLGLPFARLRCALPEEWLQGAVAESLGRRFGLSAAGLERHQGAVVARVEEMVGRGLCGLRVRSASAAGRPWPLWALWRSLPSPRAERR